MTPTLESKLHGSGVEEIAEAVASDKRTISIVWLIPIVAMLVAGWLIYSTFRDRGPMVTISFDTAEGLEAGKTKVRFKDVEVGMVEAVTLSDDLAKTIVKARMAKSFEAYIRERTQFWIVRPRVGSGGVSGLSTLVSGAYVEIDPAKEGEAKSDFVGLEEPPLIRSQVPGTSFVLTAETLGSVSRGAPIYTRGVEVGQVLGHQLSDDGKAIAIPVFIRAPFDALVRTETRFWNASGLSLSTGGDGVKMAMASVQALIVGGIEFDTPRLTAPAERATADAQFQLFADKDIADSSLYTKKVQYLVNFEGASRGLRAGSLVELRGIKIGSVIDIHLVYDQKADRLLKQALVEFEPGRLRARDLHTGAPLPPRPIAELVTMGLRAQLRTGNFLTGDLVVDIDFHPDAVPAEVTRLGDFEVIPAIPDQLEQLSASVTGILDKVASLPLAEVVTDLRETITAIRDVAAGPETRAAVDSVRQMIDNLEKLTATTDQQLPPLLSALRQAANSGDQLLRESRALVANDSPIRYDINAALRELASAAKSIRSLSEYLQRNPDALIRGR